MSYGSEDIRNVCLVGPSNAGKTQLAEALLYAGGAIPKRGSVDRGDTVSDFTARERQLGHSQYSSVCHLDHKGIHVNLIDTVFNPVMEQLGVLLIIPIPLFTMRVFCEERERGTDEMLLTSGLSQAQIIFAKFFVTYAFVILMMAVSFIYPVTAISQGGIGLHHLTSDQRTICRSNCKFAMCSCLP